MAPIFRDFCFLQAFVSLFAVCLYMIFAVRLSVNGVKQQFLFSRKKVSARYAQSDYFRQIPSAPSFEIGVVLCCKLAFIFGLWYFFFGPDKRIEQTPENVASGILMRADRTADVGN